MPIAFKCSCGKAYKVPDEAAGKKIKCKQCSKPLQVPAKKKSKPVPDDDGGDDYGMDFGLEEDSMPTDLPPRRKKAGDEPKRKKKSGGGSGKRKKKQSGNLGLKIGVGVFAFVLAGVGGFFAVKNLDKIGGPPKPIQVNYTDFKHDLGGFTVKHPSEWEVQTGGGQGGRPPFVNFKDGTARIDIRHNEKGASISMMATVPDGGQIIPGEEIEEVSPAKKVHETMAELQFSLDYTNFEEQPGKEIKLPYGEGWISEFTGKDGFTNIRAYRVTLLGSRYQYTIVCKCPRTKWEAYEKVFMDVINSMGQ